MDTSAYLTRQGWLGAGHALHPTGRGLTKPLLVTPKPNVLGLGKRKHDAHADQWWARAFDATLRQLNVGRAEATGVTTEVTLGAIGQPPPGGVGCGGGEARGSANGLYRHFVRGEGLEGTQAPRGVEHTTISCRDAPRAENEVEAMGKEEKRRWKKRKSGDRTKRTVSVLTQPEGLAASQDECVGKAVSKDKKRRRRGPGHGVAAREGQKPKSERTCVEGVRASEQADVDCQSQGAVAKYDHRLEESRKRRKRKKQRLGMDTI